MPNLLAVLRLNGKAR